MLDYVLTFSELRIHEHTERGDNESIKVAGKKNTLIPGQGGCCSA